MLYFNTFSGFERNFPFPGFKKNIPKYFSQDGGQCQLSAFRRLSRARPMGMLMLADDAATACASSQQNGRSERLATTKSALTTPTTSGPCHNYCLRGSCLLTAAAVPVCSCAQGFGGARCETDLCDNFCLQGTCSTADGTKQPSCLCPQGVSGNRCQFADALPRPG